MIRASVIFLVLVSILLFLFLLQSCDERQAAANTIIFTSVRNGNYDIYRINADGSHEINLTRNKAMDYDPAWSPDGTRIAFVSNRDGGFEIYVMNVDGSNPTGLTNDKVTDSSPTWLPDGTRIAFVSNCNATPVLYVMSSDGSNLTKLLTNVGEGQPVWSPDGKSIVCEAHKNGEWWDNLEVYMGSDVNSGHQTFHAATSPA